MASHWSLAVDVMFNTSGWASHFDEFGCGDASAVTGCIFGKKKLSPAMRNRFTEIWCPQSNDRNGLISHHRIQHATQSSSAVQQPGRHVTSGYGVTIMDFVTWFSSSGVGKRY
ncbi:hypothetical protein ACOMHN_032651 [Nucella lapillus]